MGEIRPLEKSDLPRATGLMRRSFEGSPDAVVEALPAYLERLLFDNPFVDPELPSLAYDDGGDQLAGMIGVNTHRLRRGKDTLRVGLTSYFMVDPEKRRSMAGIQLLKRAMNGPQDLSIAEGNEASKKVWTAVGGSYCPLYSIHWTSPIRPGAYSVARGGLGTLAGIGANVADFVARRVGPFRRRPPSDVSVSELDVASFVAGLDEIGRAYKMRASYDEAQAAWMFQWLERKVRYGKMRRDLLRDADGKLLGWAIWYQMRGVACPIAHLVATEEGVDRVLDHVWHEASATGAVALQGRLEPRYATNIAGRVAVMARTQPCMLIHARDPQLLHEINSGDALMTRTENEWWIPYGESAPG